MDDSGFSRLPAELRIKVYEYALVFDRVSCRLHGSSCFWPERSLSTQLALTRVCKQIRAECQDLSIHSEQTHCENGGCDPRETGLDSRYELLPAVSMPGNSPSDPNVAATFDRAPVRATADCHQDHDRSFLQRGEARRRTT